MNENKGIMQSLDFSIAFLLMLVMVVVFAAHTFTGLKNSERELNDFQQKRLSVMLVDGLLKRKAGSEMGLALFDLEKRHLQENRLPASIENGFPAKEFKLFGLKAECNNGHFEYVPRREGRECKVLSRLAYVNGKKCLLKARFCD